MLSLQRAACRSAPGRRSPDLLNCAALSNSVSNASRRHTRDKRLPLRAQKSSNRVIVVQTTMFFKFFALNYAEISQNFGKKISELAKMKRTEPNNGKKRKVESVSHKTESAPKHNWIDLHCSKSIQLRTRGKTRQIVWRADCRRTRSASATGQALGQTVITPLWRGNGRPAYYDYSLYSQYY